MDQEPEIVTTNCLRAVFINGPGGYAEVDLSGNVTFCNQALSRMSGYSADELLDLDLADCVASETTRNLSHILEDSSQAAGPIVLKPSQLITREGESKGIVIIVFPLKGVFGEVQGFALVFIETRDHEDRDERQMDMNRQLEDTNRDLEQVIERANYMAIEAEIARIELNQIFNTFADGMWVIDLNFTIQRVNQAMIATLRMERDEIIGKKCHELIPGSACHGSRCSIHRIQNGDTRVECDMEQVGKDGKRTPFILTATPLLGLDAELIGVVEAFKDISERKAVEAALKTANLELERLAKVDALTQLANRRFFDATLSREWRRLKREGQPLSLIMCDVDFFKLYNDEYGHQAGDHCLSAVARTIQGNLRRAGDFAARYGGEEFAVILPNTPGPGAECMAERIRQDVEALKIAHVKSDVSSFVTLSLGISTLIPDRSNSSELLVKAADQTLYRAKAGGRNRVVLN